MEEFLKTLQNCSNSLYDLIGFTTKRKEKSKDKIIRSITSGLLHSGCDIKTIINFTKDSVENKIWVSEEFFDDKTKNTCNLYTFLANNEYLPIIKSLSLETPTLGSPNAATGEYELLLLITTNSRPPKKNDLNHFKYGIKNLKGGDPRIFTEINGYDLNRIMLKTLKDNNIPPWVFQGVEYGQLMSKSAVEYYNSFFTENNISNEIVKEIAKVWLDSLFNKDYDGEYDFLDGNKIIYNKWLITNAGYIFKNSQNKEESYMILKENGDIYHLPKNYVMFMSDINKNKIKIKKNYFRLNQKRLCGLYLTIC